MKIKTLFTALALMCLIGSISVATAQVTKIGDGRDPAIYGTKVAWADLSGVVHLYDLSTKKDTRLSSSAASHPDIYGNKMVWFDTGSGIPRITVYDIPSGIRTFVTKDIDDWSIPHIYGNYIVWNANGGIYLRYMSPNKNVKSWQMRISDEYYADIYDTKVVSSYGENSIKLYDVSTKKTIDIPGSNAANPHIWGTKVIWSDMINHNGYIRMYDTSTKKTIDVTHELVQMPNSDEDWGAGTGSHIAIQGDKIVYNKYTDDYEGVAGVYVYSIASGKSTLLSQYNYSDWDYVDTTPEVYGNTVVWGMHSTLYSNTDDSGIYVTTIPTKPVAAFTTNKTSGKKPFTTTFTYTGTGTPDTYYWKFGDGVDSKHAVTATHTFTKAGTYTVSLKVTNSAGSNIATKSKYITVK